MRIQQCSHQGCVVLTLAGRLDLAAAPQVQRDILKQLAQPPPAIICDLAQVEAIDSLCAGVFASIRHPALGWPGTALVLSGARPAVADTLVQHGVMNHLAMYPSLDQALANARARPPRLGARLTLGPVLTAAAAGRQFVGEVCGHWGLQVLAEPAALLAGELVTNAVVHAHTALELRVELRGSLLQVAVHDQDPNLSGLLTAKDGTGRGLGLQIVDQVAKAWGVRQDGAGGKTVWCTLELPPPQAGTVGRSRRAEVAPPLTERERAVLRLLPTRLSHREIGHELYVSVNTVRSQVEAIYRKFEVTSRAEAVAHARHLRLLPGSTPTDPWPSHPDEP
jgi:anti-anti-sigma factor